MSVVCQIFVICMVGLSKCLVCKREPSNSCNRCAAVDNVVVSHLPRQL